jgi:hypothetical protein
MRRNAENLIVLAGATPGRGWRKPVPVVDVIRGALAEVEEYTRVNLLPVESASLAGRAVGDVIHLLAELIENALSFSPPYTRVHVGGVVVANGFAVEIEDRGLGMSEADLTSANDQLVHPPEFHLSNTARLGLFVVGRLAARHGIRVRLRESPYGGTTAIVLIPTALLVDPNSTEPVNGTRIAPPALEADVSGSTGGVGSAGAPAGGVGFADEAGGVGGVGSAGGVGSDRPQEATSGPDDASGTGADLTAAPTSAAVAGPGAVPEDDSEVLHTPSGLPWRKRQATFNRLALTMEGAPGPAEPPSRGPAEPPNRGPAEPPSRSPEEVRRMMASFQSGARRGRAESSQDAEAAPAEETTTDGEQS